MKRPFLIGLAIAGIAATVVIAISLASANTDSPAETRDDIAAVASPQPSATATPLPTETPAPAPTPSPLPPVASQPSIAPTVPNDSPVRSGVPPTTPPGAVSPPRSTPAPLPPGGNIEHVPAPIEKVDVLVRESFPPGYTVRIVAGLPSGCAKPFTQELERDGTDIEIRVLNEMITGMACTLIYGTYELNVDLGTDFISGEEYTLQVNDETQEFTAQ